MRPSYAILVCLFSQVVPALSGTPCTEELPFKLRDGFVWIQATAPTYSKPLNFLLDSGAQVSVVDSRIAARLGMTGGAAVSVMGVGSATTGYWPRTLNAHSGKIELPRNYLVLDLSNLSKACTNAAVDGLIGTDFFRERVVQIDYQKNIIRVLPHAPEESSTQTLPLKIRRCGMLVPVRINDSKPQWVRLDTGCASVLQWVTGSIRPEQCTRRVAVALTAFSIPTTVTTLALGSLQLRGVPTDLQENEIFPGEKGLLGNGLLSRFQTVTINAKRKEVILGKMSEPSS